MNNTVENRQWNPRVFEIGLKNRVVKEVGENITVFD